MRVYAEMNVRRPSLNALRAFEAAARLGGISAAAAELGVSHGAVSHHVGAMEALFGIPLLRRLSHSVRPTEEGMRLAATLTEAFKLIDAGLMRLQPGPLKISCSSTIMMHWLIPRLGSFKDRHKSAEIRLNVNYGPIDFVHDEVSVAIRIDSIPPPKDVIVKTLIREEIGPVCTAEYAARHGLNSPKELHAARLLGSKTRPMAWNDWWSATGQEGPPLAVQESYDHFYLQNQAAACGLGVAMTPLILVFDQINAGNLIAPFGFTEGPHEIVLWIAPLLRQRLDLRELVEWLQFEMEKLKSTGS